MKRFALFTDKDTFAEALPRTIDQDFLYNPNFNISEGESVPAVYQDGSSLKLESMIWGWKEGKKKQLSLSMEEFPEADPEHSSRCLVPANGFFVWKQGVDDPHPFYIRKIDVPLFFIAAFYRKVEEKNGHYRNHFCLIEEPANELIKAVNPTMPLIIDQQNMDQWFKGKALSTFRSAFDPLQLGSFITARVSERVNDSSENDPELIQPIPKLRETDD